MPTDWLAIVLGPVQLVRWPHMLLAAFLTTGMCVIATGAWYTLRGIHLAEARVMLHWGLGLVAVLIPVQLFFGHLTGLYVLEHQPVKFAAIEARWRTQQPASETLIGWPDQAARTNRWAIDIPGLGSLSRPALGPKSSAGGRSRPRTGRRCDPVLPPSGSWSAWAW